MTDVPTESDRDGIWAKLRRRKVMQWSSLTLRPAGGCSKGLGGGMFWWVGQLPPTKPVATNATTANRASTAPSAGASIAVLPFVDMSQGKDKAYFADGISEELLDVL
jgi:hypothetical protein